MADDKWEVGSRALGRVHRLNNQRKLDLYWIGFLLGAISSGRVERGEVPALEAEARAFVEFFGDADARDLVEDIVHVHDTDDNDLLQQLTDIVAERRRIVIGNEAMSPKDKINEFLGFCAGVICDGVVSDTEAKSIIERFSREPVLSEHPHLLQLQGTLRSAVADGVLTSEEADDIKAWIARIVGDGYSETGLASFGATPSMPDMIEDHSEIEFPERVFVVTGTLRIGPRREVAHMIEALDGIFANAVTCQTHYVVLASVASRDWKQSHFGTKIERAQALVAEGSALRFVSEPAFESALRLRTGR